MCYPISFFTVCLIFIYNESNGSLFHFICVILEKEQLLHMASWYCKHINAFFCAGVLLNLYQCIGVKYYTASAGMSSRHNTHYRKQGPQWRSLTWHIRATRVVRALSESTGTRGLAAFGGWLDRAGGHCVNISESAGASRLPGIPCSSLRSDLSLLLVKAVVVESTECLIRMPISNTLPVS
jgi:hypothetical protein